MARSVTASSRSAIVSATASGVHGLGVSTPRRLNASFPVTMSTRGALMPVPPMTMPMTNWLETPSVISEHIAQRPSGDGGIGPSQDVRAGLGHHQGVLELGRALPVLRHHSPGVVPDIPLDRAEVEHRLDGEDHARLDHLGVGGCGVVVGDDETGVELASDSVPAVVADDAVVEALSVLLDDPTDDVDLPSRSDGLDPTHHRLVGAFDQQAGGLVDLAGIEREVRVAVHPLE